MSEPVSNPPLNIWSDIEKCWVLRMDIVFQNKTIKGIHHSDFDDIVNDIDWICKKLMQYKSEMQVMYGIKKPSKRSMIATYVYLCFDHNTGLYKIGRSISPKVRERTLQSEKPNYQIVWVSQLTRVSAEKELHNIFFEKRVRGEWFKLTPDDISMIKKYDYGVA